MMRVASKIEIPSSGFPANPGSAGASPAVSGASPETVQDVHYSKRRLPHFERPWTIYAVAMTTRERRALSPAARTIALNAVLHFHLKRYELFAACVMPDHVHILFQPWPKGHDDDCNPVFWRISALAHSWKSFTAHEINRLEKTTGPLWEEETFDRYVRSDRDLHEKFQYICRNPLEARLVSPGENYIWLWTSENDLRLGSTPVPGVGESVPLSQASRQSSFRRDAETHARDGRAPRKAGIPHSAAGEGGDLT